MGYIKRKWTPKEADEWSKEDTITVILSPIIYMLLTLGVGLSILLVPAGFVLLGAAIVLMLLMVFIINPKLTAISEEYERNQKRYLDELDKKIKWED